MPDMVQRAVALSEVLRAARFFMDNCEAAAALPGTAAALVAVALGMAEELADKLDAMETAA